MSVAYTHLIGRSGTFPWSIHRNHGEQENGTFARLPIHFFAIRHERYLQYM